MAKVRIPFIVFVLLFVTSVSMFLTQAYYLTEFRIATENTSPTRISESSYIIEDTTFTSSVSLSSYPSITIRNCIVNYSGIVGIFSISNTDEIVFENNTFIDTDSIDLTTSNKNVRIIGNRFIRMQSDPCLLSITSQSLDLSMNSFLNSFGVYVKFASASVYNNIITAGPLASSPLGQSQVYLDGLSSSLVYDNTFYFEKDTPLLVMKNSSNARVYGNTFYDSSSMDRTNPQLLIIQNTNGSIEVNNNYFNTSYIVDIEKEGGGKLSIDVNKVISFRENFYADYKKQNIISNEIDGHWDTPYIVWKNDTAEITDTYPFSSIPPVSFSITDKTGGLYRIRVSSPYNLPNRTYSVYINGSLVKEGLWMPFSGIDTTGEFEYDVGLSKGEIEIVFRNGFGAYSFSDKFNYIAPNPNDFKYPVISHPDDITYKYGTNGHYIVWGTIEDNPYLYEIRINGTSLGKFEWNTSIIRFSVDGFDIGEYRIEIFFIDMGFNIVSDEVIVTVYTDYFPHPSLTITWTALESVFAAIGGLGIVAFIIKEQKCVKRGGEFVYKRGVCH